MTGTIIANRRATFQDIFATTYFITTYFAATYFAAAGDLAAAR